MLEMGCLGRSATTEYGSMYARNQIQKIKRMSNTRCNVENPQSGKNHDSPRAVKYTIEREGYELRLQSAPYLIGTRKTKEPESPEPGKVGDTVKVKGEAYVLLLRQAGTLPEELSALPKRQGNRRYRFEVVTGPKR